MRIHGCHGNACVLFQTWRFSKETIVGHHDICKAPDSKMFNPSELVDPLDALLKHRRSMNVITFTDKYSFLDISWENIYTK